MSNNRIGMILFAIGATSAIVTLLVAGKIAPEILADDFSMTNAAPFLFMFGCAVTATLIYHPKYKYFGLATSMMVGMTAHSIFASIRSNPIPSIICVLAALGASVLAAKLISYKKEKEKDE